MKTEIYRNLCILDIASSSCIIVSTRKNYTLIPELIEGKAIGRDGFDKEKAKITRTLIQINWAL